MADLIQDAVSLFLICAFSLWLLLIPICIRWLRRPDFLLQRLYNGLRDCVCTIVGCCSCNII